MNICLISPYHGGSHQAWAEGYQRHSQHRVTLLTLPARFWKWRMHGGAITLARRFSEQAAEADLLLVTDMLDLTTFLALTRPLTATLPVALYMHENQLTYPLPADPSMGAMRRQMGERDLHYAFVNYASMLAADRVFFNSEFHRQSFFSALPAFLNHYPEYKEVSTIRTLLARSAVLHIGLELQWLEQAAAPNSLSQEPPLLLWNQRWEYDKNPEAFFDALYRLDAAGIDFRLALCGQQFGRQPPAFAQAIERLAPRIIHAGYARQNHYRRLLREATVTVSTAEHEFFGISILEAIAAHTFPLLPARLSYPELIATEFHPDCLYSNQEQLVERLRWALLHRPEAEAIASRLAATIGHFDWRRLAHDYDEALEQMRR